MLGQGAGWPGKRGAALLRGGVLSRLLCSADVPSDGHTAPWWGHHRKLSASHLRASEMRIRREQRLLAIALEGQFKGHRAVEEFVEEVTPFPKG